MLNELIVTLVARRTKKCEALQNTQESVTFTCYFFIVDYLILCIQSNQIGLFEGPQTQRERNVVRFSAAVWEGTR